MCLSEWWVRCDLCHGRVTFLPTVCCLEEKRVSFSLFLTRWVGIPWWAPGCVSVHVCARGDTHTHTHTRLGNSSHGVFYFIIFLLLFKNLPVPFVEEFSAEFASLIRQLKFRHEVSKQSELLVHSAVPAVPCGRQCEGRTGRLPGRLEPQEPRLREAGSAQVWAHRAGCRHSCVAAVGAWGRPGHVGPGGCNTKGSTAWTQLLPSSPQAQIQRSNAGWLCWGPRTRSHFRDSCTPRQLRHAPSEGRGQQVQIEGPANSLH